MAQQYSHLELEDRCSIARLHEAGQSIRQIAAALDRSPSTVSRELRRNLGAKVGYKPSYAQEQARARRWNGRVRRFLPRRTNLLQCSPRQIDAIARQCNNTPRKCLGIKTPAELFYNHLLHFKCESTCRPAPA